MAELKTKETKANVDKFLSGFKDEQLVKDCYSLIEIMKKVTRSEPKMWGTSIVGFGNYHYKSNSGREGDWFYCGFLPRKQNLTVYVSMCDLSKQKDLLKKLGKHKTSKSCIYIKTVDDIDVKILKELLTKSIKSLK
jgi:ribosomal protein L20A (L18A)